MKRISPVALMILLCSLDIAFAGGNASFSVSCTIPAIPGVNTPLLVQEQVQLRPEEIIQQETQVSGTSSESQVLVKTFYAR